MEADASSNEIGGGPNFNQFLSDTAWLNER